MDDQPNENRPHIPTWVWILTIFAVILGLQLWLSGRFSGPEQISLQEVADFIRADEVEQLVVNGDRLQITLDDGRTFGAVKSPSDSLIETFQYYGISAEDLNDRLAVQDNSTWNTLLSLAFTIGPVLLLLWIFTRGFRQMQGGGGGNNIFGFGRSRARNLTDANRPTVTFDDVAGVEEAKLELAEVVQFLREPEKFVQVGARIPKGVLMVGPPATARARSVLPVPGGPTIRTPLGIRAPTWTNFSGSRRNWTTSANSSLASSTPATSSKVTVGRLASVRLRARLRPKPKMLLPPPPPCICRKPRVKIQISSRTGPTLSRIVTSVFQVD